MISCALLEVAEELSANRNKNEFLVLLCLSVLVWERVSEWLCGAEMPSSLIYSSPFGAQHGTQRVRDVDKYN